MLVTGVSGHDLDRRRAAQRARGASHTNNSAVTGILTKGSFLNAHAYDPRAYGATGDGTTDDAAALQSMFDDAPAGARIELPAGATFVIASVLSITKEFHLQGNGATIKAGADGLTHWLGIAADGWSIDGVKFDADLRAMTPIDVTSAAGFRISGCHFTGLSMDFGTPGTSESGIRMTSATNGSITGNRWVSWGGQYLPPTSGQLNRCITLNASCDDITIDGNVFDTYCQGIVVSGTGTPQRIVVSNNAFYRNRDNAFYLLGGVTGIVISGNVMDGGDADAEEGIVMKGITNAVITGNLFRRLLNKMIAYEAANTNINISGNVFDTTTVGSPAAVFADRNTGADSVTDLTFSNNVITGPSATNLIATNDLTRAVISGNVIDITASSGEGWRFDGNNDDIIIADNIFKQTGSTIIAWAIYRATTFTNGVFANNSMTNANMRSYIGGGSALHALTTRDQTWDVATSRIISPPRTKVVWSTAAPTVGPWERGDIVYTTTPLASGTIGWVCVTAGAPGTWKSFGTISA